MRSVIWAAVAGWVALAGLLVGSIGATTRAAQDGAAERAHLAEASALITGQLAGLPLRERACFIADFPVRDSSIWPVLVEAGQVVAHPRGTTVAPQARIEQQDGTCRLGSAERGRCLLTPLGSSQHLLLLLRPTPQGTDRPGTGLLVLPMIALVAALAWTLGRSSAAPIERVTGKLVALARAPQPNVAAGAAPPPTRAGGDELMQLVAAVARVRQRLARDFETHQQALTQAQVAEDTKTRFLQALNHQLRVPLTTLSGFTQLLLAGADGMLTPAQQEDVAIIQRGGAQLLALVNDVLDVSAMESGQLLLNRVPVRCDLLCREVLDQFAAFPRLSHRRKEVPLVGELQPVPTVEADPARLQQIVQNLLTNALKFTESGAITLRVHATSRAVRIEVEDTGNGISARDLGRIFDEYGQAGEPHARRVGTGLGLAITKRLVELHGGSIHVASSLGQGSCFSVSLPIDGRAS